jgi:endoglucanase
MIRFILVFVLLFSITNGQNILVNQVGYLPDQIKIAYFTQQADSFFVIKKDNNQIVFKGKPVLHKINDPSTGLTIYTGDFSLLNKPGIYQIKTNLQDTSYSFLIASDVFKNVFYKSLKGFYFQRCGTALLAANAGIYARPACHLNDATFHSSTGKTGSTSETGGWHDAGDFGKYVVNAGISVGTLLMAYELFPNNFISDTLNIPESGNFVPDILDEVRYELNWLLKMQDTADGGVYFKVTPQNFAGFIMPNKDNSIRYIYQKSSAATGDFAAMMAEAARIYLPFDSAFSSKCLIAAKKAWLFLQANPNIVPQGGFHNPPGTGTGEYGDGNDSDERLWASSELFVTTGDSIYNVYFQNHYTNNGLFSSLMSWSNVSMLAQLAYLTSKQPAANEQIVNTLKSAFKNYCNNIVNYASTDGLNVSITQYEYFWGSNSQVLNNAIALIIGYSIFGDKDFYNTALEQFNYILGCNANNICYITGVGSKYPLHPHHRPSASDGILEPIPGLMAGGPDKGRDDPVLDSVYNSSTPPALCYIDNQGSYASNEIAINWNAPLVFVAGYFSDNDVINNINEKSGSVPNYFELKQNYPNPFNLSTVIEINLAQSENVRLEIFNLEGKEIFSKDLGKVSPGVNRFVWNGKDNNNFTLSSGIYFYRIIGEELSPVKKMVLLK